jgi:FlaG/FlaF family flagellin (archaellin)
MKSAILSILLVATLATSASAQKRVSAKEMEGTSWQMVFELKKEADNAIERIALSAVDGFMDEIDIRFDFRKDGALRIRVDAFDEEDEDEYSTWDINDAGQLTMGETDSFDSDDTVFMRDGDRLVAFDRERGRLERKDSVYLIRVDK